MMTPTTITTQQFYIFLGLIKKQDCYVIQNIASIVFSIFIVLLFLCKKFCPEITLSFSVFRIFIVFWFLSFCL